MDGLRQMAAETVPAILVHIGTSMDAPETIGVARRKLGTQIAVVRALRAGSLFDQIDFHDIDVTPVGVCPTVFIRSALSIVAHEAARHAMASHVLALYVRARPNLEGTQMLQAWKNDHTRVNMHAGDAVRSLRMALALTKTSTEAIHVADSSFPAQSADWTAWMLAAERSTVLAKEAAAVARDELRLMREAAMAEYGKARVLIETVDG